jgi:uncharacterized protein YcbX
LATRVAKLRVTPVKGLAQAEVAELGLTADGIRLDRRFVCADEDDRRLYSADLGALARARAVWDEVAHTLEITFPDGSSVSGPIEVATDERRLAAPYGRQPMIGRRVAGPFASAMAEVAGRPLRLYSVPVGRGAPEPITILGDGSLARLANELGIASLDSKRFRMSIEIGGLGDAEEDGWSGSRLRLGGVVLDVGARVPRCVVTTWDPDTGERDHDTLRVLLGYRGPLPTGEPPFGVYATVAEPGIVRVGDEAVIES